MLKSFLVASCAVSLVACVKQDAAPEDVDHAIPTADQVSIKLPQQASKALGSFAVGQLANYYVATHDVTRLFNGGSAWVLILIHTIVKFPVTSVSGDLMTWGPWSDALAPTEYKLEVTAHDDGTYTYQLSGRSKREANAQFEVVIDGKADPRPGELRGKGEFLIDFDAGRRVNPIEAGNDRGTVHANYDLAARHLDLTIASTDGLGQPVLADYAYNEAADGGGDMVFSFRGNGGGGAALENATLRSRWLRDGAGRGDGRLSGGDIGVDEVTASECWNAQFSRVYYADSVNFAPTEGSAAACAFATADLPSP